VAEEYLEQFKIQCWRRLIRARWCGICATTAVMRGVVSTLENDARQTGGVRRGHPQDGWD